MTLLSFPSKGLFRVSYNSQQPSPCLHSHSNTHTNADRCCTRQCPCLPYSHRTGAGLCRVEDGRGSPSGLCRGGRSESSGHRPRSSCVGCRMARGQSSRHKWPTNNAISGSVPKAFWQIPPSAAPSILGSSHGFSQGWLSPFYIMQCQQS